MDISSSARAALLMAASVPMFAGVIASVSVESCGTESQTGELAAQSGLSCFGGAAHAGSVASVWHLGVSGGSAASTGAEARAAASFVADFLVEGGPSQGFLEFTFNVQHDLIAATPSRYQGVSFSSGAGGYISPACAAQRLPTTCVWEGRLPYVAGTPVELWAYLRGHAGGTKYPGATGPGATWKGEFYGSADLVQLLVVDEGGNRYSDAQVRVVPEPGGWLTPGAVAALAIMLAAVRSKPRG